MAGGDHMMARGSLTSTRTVAALYVTKGGTYFGLEGVDPWDEERDARLYDGPHPVVAHPPCARWSRLAGFTQFRFGLKRGEDDGCFKAALEAVHRWGGVIEHPAYSDAWKAFGLPRPVVRQGWTLGFDGGASCYVEQGRYGLPVKKATWLYAYGVELADLRWGSTRDGDGDDIGGMDAWRDRFGGRRAAWKESLESHYDENGVRHRPSHLGQHSTTPDSFRDTLIAMARTSFVTSAEMVVNDGTRTTLRTPTGKSIRAYPPVHAAQGDDRIRTGVPFLSTDLQGLFRSEGVVNA